MKNNQYKNNFVNLPKYERSASRNSKINNTINGDNTVYSNGFASVMHKRPDRLKLIEHNKSRELKLDGLERNHETKTIISDGGSHPSRLFPHVTRRKRDNGNNMSVDAYNTNTDVIEKATKSTKLLNKNSTGKANLNFVFQ